MKNTASIAYERIGASVANTRILDDELIYYSQLVSEVGYSSPSFLHRSLFTKHPKYSVPDTLSTTGLSTVPSF